MYVDFLLKGENPVLKQGFNKVFRKFILIFIPYRTANREREGNGGKTEDILAYSWNWSENYPLLSSTSTVKYVFLHEREILSLYLWTPHRY